ncbi:MULTISPECIES: flagellar biosynthesis protein FlhF [Paenibacillus]|uniref:flagellar biosynthesis protein FlhF n=1 Tax=Paenibacillus TaxID=44249 RepID=UPI0009473C81|nr:MULTISPECIES: flagellar biosynthesis protein FlhF [Paenibacillus]APQ59055.1 flagellar GTP-binding protein [Paenibacillus polymyxa]OMF82129.1 flagellar biosynthesis protein FlhF [Paenibacillus peoriae]VUG03938.1 Flagellar biosynthesis protein FlhF [Paenibacillus polymyxa]
MRVKRYVVDTMPEAMLQIRGDLGTDAVILSTKEMKVGGFMGMFSKKKIEVVAAVEEKQPQKPRRFGPSSQELAQAASPLMNAPEQPEKSFMPVVPRQAAPEAYRRVTQMTGGSKEEQAELTINEEQAASATEHLSSRSANNLETISQALDHEALLSNMKSSSELFKQPIEVSAPDKSGVEENQALLNELREMKAMMTRFSRNSSLESTWPEPLQEICEHVLEQEVERDLLEYWLEQVYVRRSEHPFAPETFDWEQAFREEVASFIQTRLDKGISKDTKIVYVAGPTGVGKTTTIAKLAAEQLFKHHRKVGFITSDTYRISAVEQLRTYATILNVPLEVVQSPGDVHRAIQRLEHCDLILMDTAGRNYRNELLVSELQSLLSPINESETYLVLSLTSKSKDMLNITGHFSKFGLGKVVFTKMDETGSCGGMFNLLHHFPMQLAYITNGQNVPDDLLHPDAEMVTSMLLGPKASTGVNGDSI